MYVQTLKQDNHYMRKSKKNNKKTLRTQYLKASNKNGNQPERRKKKENPNLTDCTITSFCRINLFWKLLNSGS